MPLRIVIDARRLRDFGVGTYLRNLIGALGRIDNENQYILTGHSADAGVISNLAPNFHWVDYARRDTELVDQVAYPYFLRQFRPDLCHIPVNLAPLFMPNPYVVTVHDLSSLLFHQRSSVSGRMAGSYNELRFRRGLMRARKVIAVSHATERDIHELLGVPLDHIRQIHSAPDSQFLCDAQAGEDLAERARVLDRYQVQYPFILYAGAIRPHKNVTRLIEAFAVLRADLERDERYRELRLIIIGDELTRNPEVRRTVIRSRVQKYVRFLGFVPVETLRVFYRAAIVFVFPSLYEGFGLPPLEAMACGTPVVASQVSSLPEVVGDAAILVNPENVFEIAHGIQDLLYDEDLRRELVQRGLEHLKRFSWKRTAEETLATYCEAAGC